MRKLLFISLLIISGFSAYGQSATVNLDYEVTYVVPNARKQTTDTVTINITKDGRYLFTEENIMGADFANGLFPNPSMNTSQSQSFLLMDTQEMMVYMNFGFGKNSFLFKMDVKDFIPTPQTFEFEEEKLELVSKKAEKKIEVNGISYDTYSIYPAQEPDRPLVMAVDSDKPVTNNKIFEELFKIMVNSTNASGFTYDIPEGLILYMELDNKMIIQVIETKKISKKVSFSYNLSIEE